MNDGHFHVAQTLHTAATVCQNWPPFDHMFLISSLKKRVKLKIRHLDNVHHWSLHIYKNTTCVMFSHIFCNSSSSSSRLSGPDVFKPAPVAETVASKTIYKPQSSTSYLTLTSEPYTWLLHLCWGDSLFLLIHCCLLKMWFIKQTRKPPSHRFPWNGTVWVSMK